MPPILLKHANSFQNAKHTFIVGMKMVYCYGKHAVFPSIYAYAIHIVVDLFQVLVPQFHLFLSLFLLFACVNPRRLVCFKDTFSLLQVNRFALAQ